jgi:germination protein M
MRSIFRKNIFPGILFFFVLLTFCGCAGKAEAEEDAKPADGVYTIFYTNMEANQLVRHKYTPASENFDGILRELLDAFCTPDTEDVQTALPAGVRINQTAVGISEIIVDFSSEYLSLGTVPEVLLRAGLVKTLLQLPGVGSIRFTVDGQALTVGGEEVGPMNEDTFIVPTAGAINSYRYLEIPLYFSSPDGSMVLKELRNAYYSSNLITERLVMEQIIRGPQSEGMLPVTDTDVIVRSVDIADGVCTVDFSAAIEDLPAPDSPVQPETTIYAFVNAVCDACEDQGVSGVRILIDGKSGGRFRGQVNLDQIFTRNAEIIGEPVSAAALSNVVVENNEPALLPEENEQALGEAESTAASAGPAEGQEQADAPGTESRTGEMTPQNTDTAQAADAQGAEADVQSGETLPLDLVSPAAGEQQPAAAADIQEQPLPDLSLDPAAAEAQTAAPQAAPEENPASSQ